MEDHNTQPEQVRVDIVEVVRDEPKSENAMLIRVYVDKLRTINVWVPYSQIHSIHKNGDAPYLMVTPWIAKKKGFM